MLNLIDYLASAYLIVFSIYHILQGIVSIFFPDTAIKFNEKLYGYKPKETEQLKMNFKPWGSLAFIVGVSGLIVFSNLDKYFIFLFAFASLLLLRIYYRIYFRKEIYIFWKVNLQNWRTISIQVVGTILFILSALSRL